MNKAMSDFDKSKEWIDQSEYDFETAKAMLKTKRYIYCVFMCHLSVEKMLKGLYWKNLKDVPPKAHSLVYLVQIQKLDLPEGIKGFFENLDEVSVPTRYPDQLERLLKVYDPKRTEDILKETEGAIKCLKQKFDNP